MQDVTDSEPATVAVVEPLNVRRGGRGRGRKGVVAKETDQVRKNRTVSREMKDSRALGGDFGNCEELPEKPVSQLLVNSCPTDYQQVTNRLPTANLQATNSFPRRKWTGSLCLGEDLPMVCWPSVSRQVFGELFFTITETFYLERVQS